MSKTEIKTISENLDVEVITIHNGYKFCLINKNTVKALAVRVNFESCVNLTTNMAPNVEKLKENVFQVVIPPSKSIELGELNAINTSDKYSYKYSCATQLRDYKPTVADHSAPVGVGSRTAAVPTLANPVVSAPGAGTKAPPPQGVEETEKKELVPNLDILIHSINNGYYLQIENKEDKTNFDVTLDLFESQNLIIKTEGQAKFVEGTNDKSVKVSVPPKSTVNVVDMPVENWDVGSCELHYKASIKKI